MSHRLSNKRLNRAGNLIFDCRECGPVKPLYVLGKPTCPNRQKEKEKAAKAKQRKSISRKAKTASRQARLNLESMWRWIVFERAGRKCEACGKAFKRGDFQLQAHHLVKRSQSVRLRLDHRNGLALCAGHHQYADRDTTWAIAIAEEKRPGTAAYLLSERRKTMEKMDWEAQEEDLGREALARGWFLARGEENE